MSHPSITTTKSYHTAHRHFCYETKAHNSSGSPLRPFLNFLGWSTLEQRCIKPRQMDGSENTTEQWLPHCVITWLNTSGIGTFSCSCSHIRTIPRSAAQLRLYHLAWCSGDNTLPGPLSTTHQQFQRPLEMQLRNTHANRCSFTESPWSERKSTGRWQAGTRETKIITIVVSCHSKLQAWTMGLCRLSTTSCNSCADGLATISYSKLPPERWVSTGSTQGKRGL